jgi:hypothetical protein
MTVYGGARADTCKECSNAASRLVGDGVLKSNAYENTAPTHSRGTHQPDFSHGAPASSFRVMGAAMHDKATAKNRSCVFGSLFHCHRNRRNRYIDSSKTRTNPAVTVVRGAPALAAAAAPGHRPKVNIILVK